MLDFKRLPEPIQITAEGDVSVIGWAGMKSFVVNVDTKAQEGRVKTQAFSLDGLDQEDTEVMSLWDWATQVNLSVGELAQLQDSLESYIQVDGELL